MEETIQIHSNLMYLSDTSSIVSKFICCFMHCSSCPNELFVLPHQLSRTYGKSKILKSIFHIKKQDFLKTCSIKVLVKTWNKMIIIKSDTFLTFLMGYNDHFLSLLHLPHFPLNTSWRKKKLNSKYFQKKFSINFENIKKLVNYNSIV